MSVEFWTQFFHAAGLEPAVAASYANIFFVNKLQPSHLPDIDRDALREMNITPMGDILTILKYIKISCPLDCINQEAFGVESTHSFCSVQGNINSAGQHQFVYGKEHLVAKAEKSFLSSLSPSSCQIQATPSLSATHYLQSADLRAGGDLPPTTAVNESPLNLTVHGNTNTKKIINDEHCNSQCLEMLDCETSHDILFNSVNSPVSCDTSEATNNIYTISPDKLEIIIPGGGTPHQKRSVFDRLGQRSDMEVQTNFKEFSLNRLSNNKWRQKTIPQRDNGIMRSNHLRKKRHCSSKDDDRVNNNTESVNMLAVGPELLPALQTKNNEVTNMKPVSTSPLNFDKIVSKCNLGNGKNLVEVVFNGKLNDAGTSNTDRNICLENSLHELHSAQERSHSLTSRILLSEPQDDRTSGSATSSVKHTHQETLMEGPGAIFITHTPPYVSISLQNEDPELEILRDPTLTQHAEQFYLAWADRRKLAHSFPALKPSFRQES